MRKLSIILSLFLTLVSSVSKATEAFDMDLLKTGRIAVAVGTVHELFVSENYPNAEVLRVDNLSDIVPVIDANKATYGVMDIGNLIELMKVNDNVEVVVDSLFALDVGVIFNKNNEKLRNEFNDFFHTFRTTDTYKDMSYRWHELGDGGVIPNIEIPPAEKHLSVGVVSTMPPAACIVNGKLEGFDVELIRHFALAKAYEIDFVDYSFAGMINAVVSEKVDFASSEVAITEERENNMLFSAPYHQVTTCVFRKKINNAPQYIDYVFPELVSTPENKIETAEDTIREILKGKIVATLEGSAQDKYIIENYTDINVQTFREYTDAIQSLVAQKSDFIVFHESGIVASQKEQQSLQVILKDFESYPIGFGINKQNTALRDEINAFLHEYNKDGKVDKIVAKWNEQLDEGRIEGIKLRNDHDKTLKVGTGGLSIPYTFISNGEYQGIDIELISLFCDYAGYNLEIIQMPFGSLIAALSTHKIDVLANSLLRTEERVQVIDFTTPYAKYGFAIGVSREQTNIVVENRNFMDKFYASFHNNVVKEDRYLLILDGIYVTLIISIFSILLGTIFGMIVCFMSMHRSLVLRSFAKSYITIVRGTPVLVLLMINFYVIFATTDLSPELVAILSFALNFGAYVSEMFRTSIESIDKGQTEAGLAMGFTKLNTFIFIVAPQAIRRVMPIYKGESISLVKMTSIVGYIAVQDITKVSDIIRSRTFDAFFPLLVSALLYFLLAYLFTLVLDFMANRIVNKR